MEQNNHKFRLRLNLFDAIILVAVLLVGARRPGSACAPAERPPPPPPRCAIPSCFRR